VGASVASRWVELDLISHNTEVWLAGHSLSLSQPELGCCHDPRFLSVLCSPHCSPLASFNLSCSFIIYLVSRFALHCYSSPLQLNTCPIWFLPLPTLIVYCTSVGRGDELKLILFGSIGAFRCFPSLVLSLSSLWFAVCIAFASIPHFYPCSWMLLSKLNC